MNRPIEQFAHWIPLTDEAFVDGGFGTPAQRAAAAARIEARLRASRAAWYALPWWVRLDRRLRWRWSGVRSRLDHAARALRGIECERD